MCNKKKIDTLPISYMVSALNIDGLIGALSENNINLGCAGGTFKVDQIKDWVFQPTFNGLMFWFCIKPNEKNVFMALEPKNKEFYNVDSLQTYAPEQHNLLTPAQLLNFDIYASGIQAWLKGGRNEVVEPNGEHPNSDIVNWVECFKSTFKDQGLNEYGFTYFIDQVANVCYLKKLLASEEVKYLRYVFAFDSDDDPNSLRLILIPVDEFGKNIKLSALEEDSPLLQYSWPPPTK